MPQAPGDANGLEALRVGEPSYAELRAPHLRIVERAHGTVDAAEDGIVTPQREPAERHGAGHGQRPDASDIAVVKQPQPRHLLFTGTSAQPGRPAVVVDGVLRLTIHGSDSTGCHDNTRAVSREKACASAILPPGTKRCPGAEPRAAGAERARGVMRFTCARRSLPVGAGKRANARPSWVGRGEDAVGDEELEVEVEVEMD